MFPMDCFSWFFLNIFARPDRNKKGCNIFISYDKLLHGKTRRKQS